MSYSDDSDGYLSNEDADYVPSDENLSEDDVNECEKEDPLNEDDDVLHPTTVTKNEKTKKRVQKLGKEENDVGEEALAPEEDKLDEAAKKKKENDLWASFLSDVGSKSKASCPERSKEPDSSESKESFENVEKRTSKPTTVTITNVFDFAGEEVRLDKEVPVDSREAKMYLKTQKKEQEEDETKDKKPSLAPGPSVKRPSGMSGILGRIGVKKQKMSTLEKSKMDWDNFISEEGIAEDLAIHNRGRDGYMERKNFLERVDHRQFEREKAVRLSNMKR